MGNSMVIYIVIEKYISNSTGELLSSTNLAAFLNDTSAYKFADKLRAQEVENKHFRHIYKIEQIDIVDVATTGEK